MRLLTEVIVLTLLLSLTALAGEGRWRTIETEHYRVHYPVAATAYAERVVHHLEDARERTETVVGREEDRIIDVVIEDPAATANGAAYSMRGRPRMVLWTTPPTSDSGLSNYRDLFEDLVVHEDLHLVHLLTPPRGNFDKLMWQLTGVGPVAAKAPRWLTEGYATVVEGQLTGFGRPNGNFRAALIRALAEEGRMPSYGELSWSRRFQGGSFAYLVGSAYLEWLLERTDPEALQRLWKRMSAKADRSFEEDFEGVFGDDPVSLYTRFRAEVTAKAIEVGRPRHEELFLERKGILKDPQLSPDGKRLATIEQIGNWGVFALNIYSTQPYQRIIDRRKLKKSRLLDRDPEDIPSIVEPPVPHERIKRRVDLSRPAAYPRWMSNTKLLYEVNRVSPRGRRTTDLYMIDLVGPEDKRLTYNANVRRADPAPRGDWAVAVQVDWGQTRLVKVNLKRRGAIIPLTDYSLDRVVDAPKVAPDGKRVVFLEQGDGRAFRPWIMDLKTKERTPIELPEGVEVADPEWVDDTRLVFGVGRGGMLEIAELDLETGRWRTLTDSGGRARSPSVVGDELVFLQMHALGYDVAITDLEGVKDPLPAGAPPIVPPPPPPDVPEITGQDTSTTYESKPYGLGRIELRPLIGGGITSKGTFGQFEFGFREGDPVGRQEALVLGSIGRKGGFTGAGAALAWRSWPVDLVVHGNYGERAGGATGAGGAVLDLSRRRGAWGLRGRAGMHMRLRNGEVEPVATMSGSAWVVNGARRTWNLKITGRLEQGLDADQYAREIQPSAYWRWFGGSWRFGQRGSAVPWKLGGTGSSAVVPDLRWSWAGGLGFGAPVSLDGNVTLNDIDVYWNSPIGTVFAQRTQLDNDLDQQLRSTLIGMRASTRMGGNPLVAIPAMRMDFGYACMIEKPEEEGIDPTWCRDLEDYTVWAGLRWGI